MNRSTMKHAAAAPRPGVLARVVAAVAAVAVAGVVGFGPEESSARADVNTVTIWGDEKPQGASVDSDSSSVELGTRFTASANGVALGVRFYKTPENEGTHVGNLWDANGKRLGTATFENETARGWQTVYFDEPVTIAADERYVASYLAPEGRYYQTTPFWSESSSDVLSVPRGSSGVYAYGKSSSFPTKTWNRSQYWVDVVFAPSTGAATPTPSPTPEPTDPATPTPAPEPEPEPTVTPTPDPEPTVTPTPDPEPTVTPTPDPEPTVTPTPDPTPTPSPSPSPTSGSFPNASNTGVPAGVTLTAYTGPMTITQPGTVIDAKRISGSLIIAAGNVTIKRSLVAGRIDSSRTGSSVTIVDSEIDGGQSNGAAIGYSNFTMTRVNVHGARISVGCDENCLITDSWLHGQYLLPGSDWHVNGFLSNGGSNMTLRHNTLACEPGDNGRGGGCTGPAATFGDFDRISNVTYDSNLFVAGPGSYCLYGGTDPSKPYGNSTTGVVVVNNVFERGANGKCAYYGPVGSFNAAASGNVWSNNTWNDGTALRP